MIEILASHLRIQMAVIIAIYMFIILRFSEKNRSQMALLYSFIIWFTVFAIKGIMLSISPVYITGTQSLSFPILSLGVICFLAILIYPIIILSPKLAISKMSIFSIAPLLLSLLVYAIYQIYIGQPVLMNYTLTEALAHKGSTSFILLFISSVFFLIYIIVMLCSIWFLVPSFQKYIQNNFSDNTYNVDWLRKYVIACSVITILYFICLYYGTVITMLLYIIGLTISFTVILDHAVRHRTFDMPEGYSVKWSFKRGWCWLYHGIHVEDIKKNDYASDNLLTDKFLTWMETDKPFCNSNFSTTSIKQHIPELNFDLLATILSEKGYNFQSYIRKCRIDESIRILSNNDNKLSYKEVAYEVGFSQYPSFCRAFIAVKGDSPSKFCSKNKIDTSRK